jgi:hypothetical protein
VPGLWRPTSATARYTDDDGTDDITLAYDAAGNLTDDGKDYKYVYDAFGRLRKVNNQSDVLVAEYTYNGLGCSTEISPPCRRDRLRSPCFLSYRAMLTPSAWPTPADLWAGRCTRLWPLAASFTSALSTIACPPAARPGAAPRGSGEYTGLRCSMHARLRSGGTHRLEAGATGGCPQVGRAGWKGRPPESSLG